MKVTDIPKNLIPHRSAGVLVFLPGRGMCYIECSSPGDLDDEERSQHDEHGHLIDNLVWITVGGNPPEVDLGGITFPDTGRGGALRYSSETYPTGDIRDLLAPALGYMGWPTDLTPYLLVDKTGKFAEDRRHGEEAGETEPQAPTILTAERLNGMQHPTLEDLLAFMNGGEYAKFFLDKPIDHPDGRREYFTDVGAAAYGRLTDLLYAVDRCTNLPGTSNGGYPVGDIIRKLDEISRDIT